MYSFNWSPNGTSADRILVDLFNQMNEQHGKPAKKSPNSRSLRVNSTAVSHPVLMFLYACTCSTELGFDFLVIHASWDPHIDRISCFGQVSFSKCSLTVILEAGTGWKIQTKTCTCSKLGWSSRSSPIWAPSVRQPPTWPGQGTISWAWSWDSNDNNHWSFSKTLIEVISPRLNPREIDLFPANISTTCMSWEVRGFRQLSS